MKFLCLFLTFYMLHISVLPCSDVHESHKSAITTVAEAESHHQDHHDICSPFCVCACCQISVVVSAITSPSITPELLSLVSHIPSTERFISSGFSFIWQPPKIG